MKDTVVSLDLYIKLNGGKKSTIINILDKRMKVFLQEMLTEMGATISDWPSSTDAYDTILYPWEFLDIEASYWFKTKLKQAVEQRQKDSRVKIVKVEYVVDTYTNLQHPVNLSNYEYTKNIEF